MSDSVLGIYDLLRVASRFIIVISIFTIIWYIGSTIVQLFNGKRETLAEWFEGIKQDMQETSRGKKRWTILFLCTLIVYFMTDIVVLELAGIHDLRLKPEGQYCFFVEAQRENGKTYTLPAQVRVNTFDGRDYYVEKVFFSNGGWLEFHNEDYIDIGESAYFYENDEEWRVKLLNEHAYSPHVTETNNAEGGDIIQMLAETIPVLFLLCACVIPLKETEED